MSRPRIPLAGVVLLLAWAATAALMVKSHLEDPFDPLLQGTARYPHNPEGALTMALVALTIELGVALLVLRPWSAPSWRRALLGLVVAVPWALFSMMMSMHAGPIVALHALWMMALSLYFLIVAIIAARGPQPSHYTTGSTS